MEMFIICTYNTNINTWLWIIIHCNRSSTAHISDCTRLNNEYIMCSECSTKSWNQIAFIMLMSIFLLLQTLDVKCHLQANQFEIDSPYSFRQTAYILNRSMNRSKHKLVHKTKHQANNLWQFCGSKINYFDPYSITIYCPFCMKNTDKALIPRLNLKYLVYG